MPLAAAARPTFPVDLLLDAITNPRARTANGTLNGTALCMACTADAPCCRKSCGAAAGRIMHPFRFPPGNGYFKSKPCRAAPGLGLDHALLPVTHIGGPNKGPTDSGGLWFYLASPNPNPNPNPNPHPHPNPNPNPNQVLLRARLLRLPVGH